MEKNKKLDISLNVRTTVSDDSREVTFVISTNTVDSHRSIIPIDAWQLDRYLKNPIVTYGHSIRSDNPDLIVGTSTIEVKENELIGKVTFEPKEINPVAEKVFQKIKAGTLRMASVGFMPLDWHFGNKEKGEDENILYFDKVELIEWSIVPVGSNPDAHKRMGEFITECKANCNINKSDNNPDGNNYRPRFYANLAATIKRKY